MADDKPIRVLAVVHRMERGGMESRLMDILRNLDYQKISIDIFTTCKKPGIFDTEIKCLGSEIYYNPELSVKNMIGYVDFFKSFLKQHPEYNIVHTHQNAWCSVFCKGAYLAGVPVRIAHSRTAVSTLTLKNIVKNVIKIPTCHYATHYFAVSKPAGKWLFGKKNMESGKVRIWKNAIECQKFRYDPVVRYEKRKLLGIQDKEVIMHVGNFTRPKNQEFLIEVIRHFKELESNCILFFVGGETADGLQKKAIEKVKEYNLSDRVCFLGNRDDVNELLQAADVFCFPSLFEGLPGAVLEAQAAGLPCVISAAITEEAKVLSTTKMISLKAGVNVWCQEIMNSLTIERRDTFDEMVHAGFDIRILTRELTKFYETVGRA